MSIWHRAGVEDDLRARWALSVDEMPSPRIAQEMSLTWGYAFTKPSIIGRAHRLGLPTRHGSRINRDPNQPRKVKLVRPRPPKPQPQPRPEARVVLLGQVRACCFPLGTPKTPEFRFCGLPTTPGQSYCHDHHKLTHVARRPPESEAA